MTASQLARAVASLGRILPRSNTLEQTRHSWFNRRHERMGNV